VGEPVRYSPPAADSCPIYQLPLVGGPLRNVRDFYNEMRPTEDDAFEIALGKNVVRYGTVAVAGVGAAAVAAIVCL
jgi:hypothetical protein